MRRMVSVVVPTYRRHALLDRCLAALATQQYDPEMYEIMVADDGACETTRRLVETWAMRAGASIRYVPVYGAHGPAAARNQGWRAAQGEIIAFTDDDCIPQPDWLAAGMRAFAEADASLTHHCDSSAPICSEDTDAPGQDDAIVPARTPWQRWRATGIWNTGAAAGRRMQGSTHGPVMGVGGRILVPIPPTPTDYERDVAGLQGTGFATANCFYRRDALMAVGGFDERFTAAWREDSDLLFRVIEQGYRIAYAPAALVIHPVRPAGWGVSIRQQRKSMFNALLYKKHPALYRQHIQAAPPFHYYWIVGAFLGALVGVASRQKRLSVIAGGMWLVLTGRFCAQRMRGISHAPQHILEIGMTSVVIPPVCIYWRVRGAFTFRVLFV